MDGAKAPDLAKALANPPPERYQSISVVKGDKGMRKAILAMMVIGGLGACSSDPRPLVPDTAEGPASYVCYSTWTSEAAEVRAIAQRQCQRSGMDVKALMGQSWTPFRCGLLTPEVAAFSCGHAGYFDGYYSR